MEILGSKRLILLVLGEAMLLALMQQITVLAAPRAGGASKPPLVVLSPLLITESDSGSQVTITADQPVSAYSVRQIGAWFELRIRNADASRVQRSFQGAGFDGGHAVQSGTDVALLFRLQPGVKASVVPGVNQLEVNFSVPARPANPSLAIKKPEDPTPAPTQSVANNPSLSPLSELNFAAPAILPAPSSSNDALLKPTLVLISDEAPLPPARIVKAPALPPASRLNLAAMTPAPMLQFPSNALIPTSVLIVEDTEPPPPPDPLKEAKSKSSAGSMSTKPNATPQPISSDNVPPNLSSGANSSTPPPAPESSSSNTAPLVFPPGILPPRQTGPQEKRLQLSGAVTLSYARNMTRTEVANSLAAGKLGTGSNDLGVGLDLNLGTYLLDPRFLKFSLGTSFFWDRGAYDEFGTRQKNTGINFYTEFLSTSQYPLRFHYTKQDSNFLEEQISSTTSGRSSLGFDWSLRKPKLPALSVSFDKTSYDSTFLASSAFKSKARTLTLNLTDRYRGWDINSNYSNQIASGGLTNLETSLNLARFDARRQLTRKSTLFFNSYFEKLHFSNPVTGLNQRFSFVDFHTDFSSKLSDKLEARITQQFYYNTSVDESLLTLNLPATPEGKSAASTGQSGRIKTDSSLILTSSGSNLTGANQLAAPHKTSTSFQAFEGELSYRLWAGLSVNGTAGARLINRADSLLEYATRFFDFSGTISWSRKIRFADTRASYQEGLEYVRTSFGNTRRVEFRSYSAGLSTGNIKRAQFTVDYGFSTRPDLFQIGGSFTQQYFNAGVESRALRSFQIRATVGEDHLDYLNSNGRERFNQAAFSASLDHKRFTVLLARNARTGSRDIFLVPISLSRSQVFIVLPVNSLVRDPLLNTASAFSLALVRVRPRRNLDVELRYLNDRLLFVGRNDVFVKHFDLLVTYKIGKVYVTGGAISYRQMTAGLSSNDRNYYFFRVSRPFKIR